MTAAEGLDHFQRAMIARTEPSLWTRTQTVRYARKAVKLLNAGESRDRQRQHAHGPSDARRIPQLAGRQAIDLLRPGPVPHLVQAARDHRAQPSRRPRPRRTPKTRSGAPPCPDGGDHTAVSAAVAAEPIHVRDMITIRPSRAAAPRRIRQFALERGQSLAKNAVTVAADRMKNGEPHTLPLSTAALAILQTRPRSGPLVFPTLLGKPYLNWPRPPEAHSQSNRPAGRAESQRLQPPRRQEKLHYDPG